MNQDYQLRYNSNDHCLNKTGTRQDIKRDIFLTTWGLVLIENICKEILYEDKYVMVS